MFQTGIAVRSVCDITPALLRSIGVRGLLLDIDNTLTTHDNPEPAAGVAEWVALMKQSGIQLRLISNNHEPRVAPFAKKLGIPCICESWKPLGKGFRTAMKQMHLPKEQLCVVGDQIYTDIWGANLFRVRSIYVRPIQRESWKGHEFLCVKRVLELPFLPKSYEYLPAKNKKESK